MENFAWGLIAGCLLGASVTWLTLAWIAVEDEDSDGLG